MFCLAFVYCAVYYVDMYIARATWPSANGKSYEYIYLRESYRDGTHVRKRNIANLTHCDPKELPPSNSLFVTKTISLLWLLLNRSNCTKVLPSAPCGPSIKWPNDWACAKYWETSFPVTWHCGKSWRACWSKGPAYRPYVWRRSMPLAPCWAGNAALTKTISTTISPG